MRTTVLAVLAALIAAVPAGAAPADYRSAPGRVAFALDATSPYIPSLEAVAALPDGTAIVAGTSGRRAFTARLRRDGGLDRGYGRAGIARLPGIFVAGLVPAADGSVTVVMDARAGAAPPPRLVRLDASGRVDAAYGEGGRLDLGAIHGEGPVAATPDGGVVVAGPRKEGDGIGAVRVTPAGVIDAGFGGGLTPLDPRAAALAVQPDGRVLVLGGRSSDEGLRSALSRLDATGVPEPSFDVQLPVTAGGPLVIDAAGRIWIAGVRASSGRGAVARVLADGRLDPSFSGSRAGVPDLISALFVRPDGGALVAGLDRNGQALLTQLADDGSAVAGSGTSVRLGGGAIEAANRLQPLGGGFYTVAGGALRPDGSVLLAGSAALVGPEDEEGDSGRIVTQPAVVALRPGGGLVRSFGRPTRPPRLAVGPVSLTRGGRALALRVRSSAIGLARVTVSLRGRVIARRMVPFYRAGRRTVRATLTRRVPVGAPITVRVAANDMAGNSRRRTLVRAVR